MSIITNEFLENFKCYVDLHLHLDGSLSNKSIRELSKISNVRLPELDSEMEKLFRADENCKDLTEFLEKFEYPSKLLQSGQALKMATSCLIEEIASQGVMYAEIRFAPAIHTEKGLTQEDAINAVIEGTKSAPIPVGIILCLMRGFDEESNMETINMAKKYLGSGVVAIDLAGAEALYSTNNYKDLFEKVNDLNVPFTIHAGEADGPESVIDALDMGAKRIGHGVRSFEDENLIKRLAKENVLLELCPTSNMMTRIFDNFNDYPITSFIENGVKVSINTDDMAVCNTDIQKEWKKIVQTFSLDKMDMKRIIIDTIINSFANDNIKKELLNKIRGAF